MKNILIVGGTGQLGLTLKKYFIRTRNVIITSRYSNKVKEQKKLKIIKLNINSKKKIKTIMEKYLPEKVFYFAGQSSPKISFTKKKETMNSNYIGCKNFLEVIKENRFNTKFFNASSCEIYGNLRGKIKVSSPKYPVSPYGFAKLKSFKITKYFREIKNLKTFNIIFFNTESIYRKKFYLIPKICFAAINAAKFRKKTFFGNLDISREWNWADDQCRLLVKFSNKYPQDFILSNGKSYTAKAMLNYAFGYFKLDYKNFVRFDKKHLREKDIKEKKSNYLIYLKKNKIKKINYTHGKKIIHLLINHYLKHKLVS